MGNLGIQELLLIAAVALFVFGPERLPELARQAGKALARVRQETSKSVAELKRAADLEDLETELRSIRQDITDVRSSVVRSLTADPSTPRPADAPPPMDPDAT